MDIVRLRAPLTIGQLSVLNGGERSRLPIRGDFAAGCLVVQRAAAAQPSVGCFSKVGLAGGSGRARACHWRIGLAPRFFDRGRGELVFFRRFPFFFEQNPTLNRKKSFRCAKGRAFSFFSGRKKFFLSPKRASPTSSPYSPEVNHWLHSRTVMWILRIIVLTARYYMFFNTGPTSFTAAQGANLPPANRASSWG